MGKWEKVNLGDVCEIARGGSPRPIDSYITEDSNGISWIRIGDASEDSMFITETKQKIKPEGMKNSRFVHAGDFLLSNSMSFGRPYIMAIDGCIHDGWLVLSDQKNHFDKKYLYYTLSSKAVYRQFKALAVGGVVNNLNTNIVRQVKFPLPPIEEQQKIADTLDAVSDLLKLRKQQLAELDKLVKSQFIEMFGDPRDNPMNWNVITIDEVFNVGSSKRIYQREQVDNGVPFLRISDLVKRINYDSKDCDLYITNEKYEQLRAQSLVPSQGDILVTSRGTLGLCYIIKDEDGFYFQDGMISWLHKKIPEINSQYIAYLFRFPGFRKQIDEMPTGSTVNYLSLARLAKLKVMYPPKEVQDMFTTFVAQVDKSKVVIQQALDQTQTLFNSLMSEYFE